MSTTSYENLGPRSLCVHAGWRPDAERPAVVPDLCRSSTFAQSEGSYAALREGRGREVWIYSRYSNPTVEIAERRIAALEGAEGALLFASGLAALHAAVLAVARPGSILVVAEKLYGGTLDLLEGGLAPLGFGIRRVDPTRPESLEPALEGAALLLCESISNPTLEVADLPRLAERAHAHGARLVVDATFASPILQRPLALGADLVMHSATKLLGGHSDLVAGVVAGSRTALEPVWQWRKRAGGCLDPEAAWLLERGLKTLALRVRAQSENAELLARALLTHPRIRRIFHPALEAHPSHALARRLLAGYGTMLSFEVEGGDAAALRLVRALELILDAPSLGGVESLASLPAYMSHSHLGEEGRAAIGIGPGFVRLSLGIEDASDLLADVEQALARC